jgi:cyanophycin synthetase
MKIISINGTKGKTTITRILSYLLKQRALTTLRVDNDGHYINERQKSSLDDSLHMFGKAPSVCPGKYLITMQKHFPDFTAILETSIGSRIGGLGYRFHDIGIFTNIYEDHIQKHKGIRNRLDLAIAKDFIVKQINQNGFLVFNADDKYVCSQLKKIPENKKVSLLPIGLNFDYYEEEKHLSGGGQIITVVDGWVAIKTSGETIKIIAIKDLNWTFDGFFKPSVYNLMLVVGGLYACFNKKITSFDVSNLKKYKPDPYGGRLILMKNSSDIKIIIDY